MSTQPIIRVENIYKNFGVTVALNQVSFEVMPGEIRGLIGENGSGKSTVASIIAGMQPATSGTMYFNGNPWKPATVLQAQNAGIAMIIQEAGTVPNISVAENLFLGHEDQFAKGPLVNRAAMNRAAIELLEELEIDIDPSVRTGSLDMGRRKLIEIAKAMYWKPKLFIIDETSTALSQSGREILYKMMHKLRDSGASVLFISHELDELIEHCDSLTIFRDGLVVGKLEREEFEASRIKQMMIGRTIEGNYYRADMDGYSDEVVLRADCITTLKDILCFSLELHRGEILGIGGLSHCGMHTLGKALFGAEPVLDGKVIAPEYNRVINKPKTAIDCRIGYLSKDRDTESLSLAASVYDNIATTGYIKNTWMKVFVSGKKEKKYVDEQIKALSLKCASPYHSADTLSGGNKQKVAFGKWLACDSNILILDCPTRGIDIGVRASVYQLIYEMKKAGKSIILISEELPELIGMSDRILIMRNGEISCEMHRYENPTESTLIDYMF